MPGIALASCGGVFVSGAGDAWPLPFPCPLPVSVSGSCRATARASVLHRVGQQTRRMARSIADRTWPADRHRQPACAASPSCGKRHGVRQQDARNPFAPPFAPVRHTRRHSTRCLGLDLRRRDERTTRTQKGRTPCSTGSGLSSTRFQFSPDFGKAHARATAPALGAYASSSICAAVLGKRTVKRLPCPGADVTSTDPPWRSITAFTNGSPRPTPPLASRYMPST